MSGERIDFGELQIELNDDIKPGDVWLGPIGEHPSRRLIEAFARGEVTAGGMAEAGWQFVGKIDGDGPRIDTQ